MEISVPQIQKWQQGMQTIVFGSCYFPGSLAPQKAPSQGDAAGCIATTFALTLVLTHIGPRLVALGWVLPVKQVRWIMVAPTADV